MFGFLKRKKAADPPAPAPVAADPLLDAAARGDPDAQCSLGEKYFYGRDIEKDQAQAVEWYQKAAEQGHAQAQLHLG